MKRLSIGILLATLLSLGVFAAETVIYENDFSDPSTLSDFTQYCQEWEIRDGGLFLTETFLPDAVNKNIETSFAHILYDAGEDLTDYIVEVDYKNIQTAGGLVFRADTDLANHKDSGFCGYLAFISNDANRGVLGCAATSGSYKGNIHLGATGKCNVSDDVHIKVTVKGDKIHMLFTNLGNGQTVLDHTYTIGTSEYDEGWSKGTVGFRMRAQYAKNFAVSADNAYFDNLKITTANEVSLGGTTVAPQTPVTPSHSIDTSALTVLYENKFDDTKALNDFSMFGGNWAVRDGRLYLTSGTLGQSYILYSGEKELTTLSDYVVDVDIYNVQTQGGILIRCDLDNVTGDTDAGFMGYQMFTSNNGTLGAIGAGKADGKWLDGNIKVSGAIMQPGMDVHLQAAVKGNLIQFTVTDLASGKLLWTWCQEHTMWTKGTFGFRMRATASGSLSNLNATAIDNLVVSAYGEAKKPTEVKLQIGNMTGYVNGVASTLDAAPIIRNSRTMLPVRFVAEALGATVGWDGATSTVTVTTDTTKLEIKIGATTAKINGAEVTLDSPAFIENSRTYLPVRFVAENLGATVAWDGTTSTATLTK